MSGEHSKDSNVKSTIEAVTGLVKAVPIYDDAIQPAAKQVGKSLETLTKAVNMALLPLRGLVWGYEQIEEWLNTRIEQKLKDVPPANIVTPLPQIAGPSIEALRYVAHDENLRELYANLLATAMNVDTLHLAHPAYVEVLKSLSSDEAILLRSFIDVDSHPTIDVIARLKNDPNHGYHTVYTNFSLLSESKDIMRVDLIPSYFNNLCRLGILEQPFSVRLNNVDYNQLKDHERIEAYRHNIISSGLEIGYKETIIRLTSLGINFVTNVVKDS